LNTLPPRKSVTATIVSTGKPTSQSSTAEGGVPNRAVDRNTDGTYAAGSCTHTENQVNAWWTVDLQATYTVDKVVVYNRVDCCSDRLRNTDVSIDGQLCGTISQEATVNTIDCGNKLGRIVKVALKGSNFLTLCEVEVWGSTSAAPAPYTFLFNGCPRGGAITAVNAGNLPLAACQAKCDGDAACIVIEVNGCLSSPTCGGACWLFKGSGQITNGNCDTSGNQKSYRKPA